MATISAKRPREKKGLSEAELAAAIEGILQPREVKGASDRAALGMKSRTNRAVGSPIGITTGFTIFGFWAYIFAKNERAPGAEKLTDEQLTEAVRAEFPGRHAKVWANIPSIRHNYNHGMFTKGTPPKLQSNRYDSDGNVVLIGRSQNTISGAVEADDAALPVVKTADDKGRVVLSRKFANRTVIVEELSDTEVLIKLAKVIPEREAWLYQNPQALASVRKGLAQARAGQFVPGPDLEADADFVAQLED